MDHHDGWEQWPEDEHGLGDADTADLDGHLGDPGGHDHLGGYGDLDDHDQSDLGHDDLGHDDLGHDFGHGATPGLGHDLSPAPDLVHEGGLEHGGDFDADQHDLGAADQHDLGTDTDTDAAHPGHLVGADPDLPAEHHDLHGGDFPPPVDLDHRPDPSDGYPWADPDTLGDPGLDHGSGTSALASYGGAPAGDLFAYAGMDPAPAGTDPWQHLLGSDDPATSSLARWWGPFGN
jgi:hypothetical protein